MFTFDATPVKFVGLLIMFAFTTGWGIYELTRPTDWRGRVSGIAHLWMSIVMLLMVPTMVWMPFVKVVPQPLILATQAASTLWFIWLAVRATSSDQRLHFAGHAAMFGAMTWHLAAMAVIMDGVAKSGLPKMQWMMSQRAPGQPMWIAAVVGLPFMVYLLVAGVRALVKALAPASGAVEEGGCHAPRTQGTATDRLGKLSEAAMNIGMFWMSTGLMTALLPFMALLAF